MHRLDKEKYLLDGEPITGSQLIDVAASVDEEFDQFWLKSTSRAAAILRANGQTVEENRDFVDPEEEICAKQKTT